MAEMQLTFSDDDGVMTFNLTASGTPQGAKATLKDTAEGVELSVVITEPDGRERVIENKLDRATPPLHLMLELVQQYNRSFSANAQGAFNRARLRRLVAEGKPLTLQNMCMCGMHTGPEYADIPFHGGIVGLEEGMETGPSGLPEPSSPQPSAMTPSDQEMVRKMLDWLPEDDDQGEVA